MNSTSAQREILILNHANEESGVHPLFTAALPLISALSVQGDPYGRGLSFVDVELRYCARSVDRGSARICGRTLLHNLM